METNVKSLNCLHKYFSYYTHSYDFIWIGGRREQIIFRQIKILDGEIILKAAEKYNVPLVLASQLLNKIACSRLIPSIPKQLTGNPQTV